MRAKRVANGFWLLKKSDIFVGVLLGMITYMMVHHSPGFTPMNLKIWSRKNSNIWSHRLGVLK